MLKDEVSPEGHKLRRVHDLKLERDNSPMFILSWSVFHPIDKNSPLYGMTAKDLEAGDVLIIISMLGHDSTYAQNTHARYLYNAADVRFGRHFVDVISRLPDGRMLVDYTHFHDTVPDDDVESRPSTPPDEGSGHGAGASA